MTSRARRVDCSASSYLPLCPECSWRGLPHADKPTAHRAALAHAAAIHGRDRLTNAATARRLAGAA